MRSYARARLLSAFTTSSSVSAEHVNSAFLPDNQLGGINGGLVGLLVEQFLALGVKTFWGMVNDDSLLGHCQQHVVDTMPNFLLLSQPESSETISLLPDPVLPLGWCRTGWEDIVFLRHFAFHICHHQRLSVACKGPGSSLEVEIDAVIGSGVTSLARLAFAASPSGTTPTDEQVRNLFGGTLVECWYVGILEALGVEAQQS